MRVSFPILLALALSGILPPGALPDPQPAGIAWYATLESGLREAKQSGRPILLVAAAPHCSGVPGVW